MTDPYLIKNRAELRDVIPDPNPMLEQKIFDHVDEYAERFIRNSPLIFASTTDSDGKLDVSPKGDAPGFVAIENASTLLIPERPGNRLAYGFLNLISKPEIGLIFIIPGVSETLRVNGTAELTRNPEILERLSARGKPAILCTRVRVREAFFHCGKAMIRSHLWKPETWPKGVKANIGKQIASRGNSDANLAEAIEDGLRDDYQTGLY